MDESTKLPAGDTIAPEGSKNIRRVVVFTLVAILVLWAATLPVLSWLVTDGTPGAQGDAVARRGQVGDAFGSINALFSGLALAGVIVAILLQREELRLQRKELEGTRAELRRQSVAAEKALQHETTRASYEDIRAAVRAYRDLAAAWDAVLQEASMIDASSRGIRIGTTFQPDGRFKPAIQRLHMVLLPQLDNADVTCSYLDLESERSAIRGAMVASVATAAHKAGQVSEDQFSALRRAAFDNRHCFDRHVAGLRRLLPRLPSTLAAESSSSAPDPEQTTPSDTRAGSSD